MAPELLDIHVRLLRKLRKVVHVSKWERALTKFCYSYNFSDAYEIERFGYKKASLAVKLRILKVSILLYVNLYIYLNIVLVVFARNAIRFEHKIQSNNKRDACVCSAVRTSWPR